MIWSLFFEMNESEKSDAKLILHRIFLCFYLKKLFSATQPAL